ncbi:hypothetical protein Pyn_12383 [Prunus yedoensis var. nudiflora]|uniref:Uncharacterized protein n=1 Tax=Prunus yedoensis var. nudiflora TaxID=2094558 RepID=A0A314Y3I4_PRUYE|nr:hypothetical protein Pyn_12383 [Prunus yedoensis var. nudiflora]
MKWTKLRTGALLVRFMGVDLKTIMFNMERGQVKTEMSFVSKECYSTQREKIEVLSFCTSFCLETTRGL